jgi:ABC-type branched-subunit amino acid transport system substrate-binding protein
MIWIISLLLAAPLVWAESIKIGVMVPLTGPFARYGIRIQEAISSYASEHVSFVFEDEGCDPKMAVSAYKKLSALDGITLFLGPWCGSPQSAVAP